MTTIAAPVRTSGERRALQRAFHAEMSGRYLLSALAALAAAVPLALVVAPMPFTIIGWIYAGAWGLIVVPSIGAYSALLYDALLIALNRQPLFLPTALASYRRLEMDQRRALKPFRRMAALAYWISPISNVVAAAIVTAIRLRPRLAREIIQQADAIAKGFQQAGPAAPREPMAEMTQPVILQVERELDVELQAC